ncbi:hypothetical protein [Gimesia fumaroli]|uniref:Carboxypeptidase regulatory-like domain-containing protein n=1 Tax=Gimesia fumaroli TaxID=2527976 RepID=A0A518IDM8_9PLAN|nr:hypothetical protein [Gimesia fumaroli]QDV51179.1 hypothetical protein Enr17x_32330 [Gimesia fumaroli]
MIRNGLILGLLSLVLSGCGTQLDDEPLRRVVQGTVIYEDSPVTDGLIRFTPLGEKGGPASAAYIENGTFVIDHKGGVPLGKHRVQVEAYRPVDKKAEISPMDDGPTTEQFLPEKWNSASTLEFQVDAGKAPLKHEFNLKKEAN